MLLERARIKNFRSLRDVEVSFGAHTALIGGNGAGKSSILKAIEKFYSTAKNCDPDDFFGRNQEQPIEIELTFHQLTIQETAAFGDRVRDGKLLVTRIFDGSPTSGRYHGVVPQNADFVTVRAHSAAAPRRAAYSALREIIRSMPTCRLLAAQQRLTKRCSNGRLTILANWCCCPMMVSFSASRTIVAASSSGIPASCSSRRCGRLRRTQRTARLGSGPIDLVSAA